MARDRTSRAGFTLAEIVIAMGLLALGVFSTIGLTRWVVQATNFSTGQTTATFLAQDKLEDIVNRGYSAASSGSDTSSNMTRTWTVTTVGSYKTVSVSVTWYDIRGRSRTMTMNSILAEQ